MPSSCTSIAFIVEGETEVSFLANFLLPYIFGWEDVRIRCYHPNGSLYKYSDYKSPDYSYNIVILNAGCDGAVVSTALREYESLINKGRHVMVYGLRDVFSDQYKKNYKQKYPGTSVVIDEEIVEMTQNKILKSVEGLSDFKLFFSVMEMESWILSLYNHFERAHPECDIEYINLQLGIDVRSIDPEKKFLQPCGHLKKLKHLRYKKGFPDNIVNNLDWKLFASHFDGGRFKSFKVFYDEVSRHKI